MANVSKTEIMTWAQAVLDLAAQGAAHEADSNEDLVALGDQVECAECGPPEDPFSFVLRTTDGRRFLVSLKQVEDAKD